MWLAVARGKNKIAFVCMVIIFKCLFYCRLPHWIAVTLSLLLAVLVITLLGILIALSISQLIQVFLFDCCYLLEQNSDKYTARATDILNKTTTWLEDHDFDVSAAGFFGTGLLVNLTRNT